MKVRTRLGERGEIPVPGIEAPQRGLPAFFSHKIDMKYRAPAMEVRFQDAKGGEVGRIDALVYVYFNIARTERNLWLKSGMQEIAIWFASQETGSWEICPTYFVHQSRENGTVGRLACQCVFSRKPKPRLIGVDTPG